MRHEAVDVEEDLSANIKPHTVAEHKRPGANQAETADEVPESTIPSVEDHAEPGIDPNASIEVLLLHEIRQVSLKYYEKLIIPFIT